MKTVNIKGKEYVTVAERLKHFRQSPDYQGWGIEIDWLEINQDRAIAKALIKNSEGVIKSTGTAMENKDDKMSMVNKTSHIENCETSAIGRALGNLGIGLDGGDVATYEEVVRAKKKQTIDSINNMIDDENIKEYEEKYNLNELAFLPLEELENIEKKLLVKEKTKLCKAITKMCSNEEINRVYKQYNTKRLEILDLKELVFIHDTIANSKFKISKKELQDLQECAEFMDLNLKNYTQDHYNKNPEELTKDEYKQIKEQLNKQ